MFAIELYDAVRQMIAHMHVKAQTLVPEDRAQGICALYLERMLGLIVGALDLVYREDVTASVILTRGALECYVDLCNLSRDGEKYLSVLRAMLLESRSAIFHFKTQPHYSHFVEELGESGAVKMGKEIAAQFKECLKEATEYYPILRYQARNLSVLNRFRIAGMEDRYHTEYTWLSMEAHNALEPLLIGEGMRRSGGSMDEAQDGVGQATVIHFVMEFLVDTVRCIENMFGADDEFARRFLDILQQVADGSDTAN